MRPRSLSALAVAALLALGAAACGEEDEPASTPQPRAEQTDFPAGSKMAELSDQGSIKIGVKKDQPGIGFEEPGATEPCGLDIEIGKILAGKLGIDA